MQGTDFVTELSITLSMDGCSVELISNLGGIIYSCEFLFWGKLIDCLLQVPNLHAGHSINFVSVLAFIKVMLVIKYC